jgi:polyhydroxybutyrate depolymerase
LILYGVSVTGRLTHENTIWISEKQIGRVEINNTGSPRNKIMKRAVLILLSMITLCLILAAVVFFVVNQSNGEIVSSDQLRKYILYVPDTYDPSIPTPLVISLHGFAEWPAHMLSLTSWDELAEEYGFIVVFPSGTNFPKRWGTDSNSRRPEDPMLNIIFISDLIDALGDEYNIDQGRIYANGFSNGGGMSFFLACELADRIAAIGGVASADYYQGDGCQPSRSVPIIAFHGTEDNIVPYYGRQDSPQTYQQPGIPKWIKTWAERNECDLDQVELLPAGEVSGIKFTQCSQNAEVYLYTIHGGGHSWPGGEPMPRRIVGHTTQDIDAAAVMWEFFSQYSLDE